MRDSERLRSDAGGGGGGGGDAAASGAALPCDASRASLARSCE